MNAGSINENIKDAIIIGAGPAGLGAATKLVKNKKSILILEKENQVGGISKTIKYKDYRFDLGGHRFFTKSKKVNKLWQETLGDNFLTRQRLSRLYYRNKFFNYPIKPMNALKGLGLLETILILGSYTKSKIFPYKEEKTFKQWVSNRFGKRLFTHFFKSYTEKLWGIPCDKIQAEWAAQRIKGLSLKSTIKNAFFPDKKGNIKTLIDEFQYPKFGPGMMYEKMAKDIEKNNGEILLNNKIAEINHENKKITNVIAENKEGDKAQYKASYFLSSMPITLLIEALEPKAPDDILRASLKLTYRSFITVSIILKTEDPFPDTWIYVHSPEVKLGRIQNFRAWSPYMVPNKNHAGLGLEYFCTENDELWKMENKDLINLALEDLEKIKLGKKTDLVDGFVIRVPNTYPVYDDTYPQNIKIIREYLDKFINLQPIGRYGMFKYNNMDHSILTGLYAAENILGAKHNIWQVNADKEYHETK